MSRAPSVAYLGLWRYRVALQGPAPVREREGALLAWQSAGGERAWSEIAPLPGFSPESLDACLTACRRVVDKHAGEGLCQRAIGLAEAPAAARFGLESGCFQLQAGGIAAPSPITSASLLSSASPAKAPTINDGTPLKVKIGDDPAVENERIRALLAHTPPHARLRLDANRSYSPSTVELLCHGLDTARVEFIEEPLQAGASYADWHRLTRIPFAWDETLREHPELDLAQPGLAAVVLKPMLTGLSATRAWVTAAQRQGCRTILSATFESNLSLDLYARLAQTWGLPGPHGLDTFGPWPHALLQPLASQPQHAHKAVCGLDALEYVERLI